MNNVTRIGTPMFKTRKKVVAHVQQRTQLKYEMKNVENCLQEGEEVNSKFMGDTFLPSFREVTCGEHSFVNNGSVLDSRLRNTGLDTLRCSTPVDRFVQKDFIYDNRSVSPILRVQPSVLRTLVNNTRRNLSFIDISRNKVCSTKRNTKSEECVLQKPIECVPHEPIEAQPPESSFRIRERLSHCGTDLNEAANPVHLQPVLTQDLDSLPEEAVLQRQLEFPDNHHVINVEREKRSKIVGESYLVGENIKTKPSNGINGCEDGLGPEEALLHESPFHMRLQLSESIGQMVAVSPIPENPLPIRALSPIADPTQIQRDHPIDDNVKNNKRISKRIRMKQRVKVVDGNKNKISPNQIGKCAKRISQQLCEIGKTVHNESPMLMGAQLDHSSNEQDVATGSGLLSPVLVQDSTEPTVQSKRKLPVNVSIGNKKRKTRIETAVEDPQELVELRRSKRKHRKPLLYWRNERYQFIEGSGFWEVIGIRTPIPKEIRRRRGVPKSRSEETNGYPTLETI